MGAEIILELIPNVLGMQTVKKVWAAMDPNYGPVLDLNFQSVLFQKVGAGLRSLALPEYPLEGLSAEGDWESRWGEAQASPS